MSSKFARRVKALEAGPIGLNTVQGWAGAYGWAQVYEWDRLRGDRARAKLQLEPGEHVPGETPLEHQYHSSIDGPITLMQSAALRAKFLGGSK